MKTSPIEGFVNRAMSSTKASVYARIATLMGRCYSPNENQSCEGFVNRAIRQMKTSLVEEFVNRAMS